MSSITFPKGQLPASYFTADRSSVLLGVGITFLVLETIAFGLRVAARKIKGIKWTWDDALMVPALLSNYGVCVICILCLRYGVGKHTLAVIKTDPTWPSVGHNHLAPLSIMALPIAYLVAISFSKLAILNLFLQIFQFGFNRILIYILGAAVILQCIVCIVVTILQCHPVSLAWTSITRKTCIDVTAFFRLASLPNIITDVVMLIMPLPTIWQLHAPPRIKIGITITFLTASIGILSSVLRFVEFEKTDIFADVLWNDVNLLAYSIAEPGTVFVAACLVTYRPLLKHIFGSDCIRKLFSKNHTAGSQSVPPGKGSDVSGKGDAQRTRSDAKKQRRGFNSVLLSALSKDSRTATDFNENLGVLDENLHSPEPTSHRASGSIV